MTRRTAHKPVTAASAVSEAPTPRETQAAYDWLRRRGGTGCFVADGRMIAAGSPVSDAATVIAHGQHSDAALPVWNALRLARRVEFFASQSFECVKITGT